MIELEWENAKRFDEMLERINQRVRDTTPLMAGIAAELAHQTELNFEAEGRPAWLGLKTGRDGKILQDSGQLAASISTDHGQDFAQIGSNKVYAAIHQLGGKTKPHVIEAKPGKMLHFGGVFRKRVNHPGSNIPARPYLPFLADGSLQVDAEVAVLEVVQDYLRGVIEG